MNEKEIVIVVFVEITLKLFCDRLGSFEFFHSDQLSKSLVHRVYRNAGWLQFITFLEGGNRRLMRNSSHQKPVGGMFAFQQRQSFFIKLDDQLRGRFLLRRFWICWSDRRDF